MAEQEKLLFKVENVYFSTNFKDWKKIVLASTDLNVWIKTDKGWKKIPNEHVSISEIKDAAGGNSILVMVIDNTKTFIGGKKPKVYSLYNALMSVLPTASDTVGAIKFTDAKRLVLKALYHGVRRPENIMPLVKRDYDEIVSILEEFKREGICTEAGILTEKGKLIMMEEGYK
jgi:hypothetical protein